jgi:ubiquinone/menaquinone biosynthesis C-methylase UbiE
MLLGGGHSMQALFANPFHITDLQIFDSNTLHMLLADGSFGLTTEQLAHSLHNAPEPLVKRIQHALPHQQHSPFKQMYNHPLTAEEIADAQQEVLDRFFWELTYWKTPELYEELIEGEQLHPGIFQHLEREIHGKSVLDVGAGSGRATLECLRYGARSIHAVEPSPGLRRILQRKLARYQAEERLSLSAGRFEALPLADQSVDTALSCSAFTADPAQGGEAGLAEMKRVTRPGGKIVIIWPRSEDLAWLRERGFRHVVLPVRGEMAVHFRSLNSALHCARRFYAHNQDVTHYILNKHRADIPFSVIGSNPPRDYCWLEV